MNQISLKAPAKINLSLYITGRRADGYHELKSVMQQISLCDELTLTKREEGILLNVESDGTPGSGHEKVPSDGKNIAYRAAELFFRESGIAGGAEIKLIKHIPAAAGLAGGSTDAAAVLKGLAQLYESGHDTEALCSMGVKLGADVPFCILGGRALCEGIGDKLTPLTAEELHILLIKPPIEVSTKEVYEAFDALPPEALSGTENSLALVTEKKYPVIAGIREDMSEQGAYKALMSGSGPTVFGLFKDAEAAGAACRELSKKYSDCFTGVYGI
ncbi:MAG: 4-(cytidine 5'-diphospho)-2-C-methyl-D-erythritol kinase [Lachnospiraceae bacterium]|nr:4-(cytidine 5'-diphospho)-2-C-methyl-D-erythritol kinase [Lachnospiraceae bacterium]